MSRLAVRAILGAVLGAIGGLFVAGCVWLVAGTWVASGMREEPGVISTVLIPLAVVGVCGAGLPARLWAERAARRRHPRSYQSQKQFTSGWLAVAAIAGALAGLMVGAGGLWWSGELEFSQEVSSDVLTILLYGAAAMGAVSGALTSAVRDRGP